MLSTVPFALGKEMERRQIHDTRPRVLSLYWFLSHRIYNREQGQQQAPTQTSIAHIGSVVPRHALAKGQRVYTRAYTHHIVSMTIANIWLYRAFHGTEGKYGSFGKFQYFTWTFFGANTKNKVSCAR
jgi:hypothetical protein